MFLHEGMSSGANSYALKAQKYFLMFRIDSLQRNYSSALKNHILYKLHYDSLTNMDQRKQMDELTIRYAAEKKDQDIKLLKQQGVVQQAELQQNKLARNIMIAGVVLLLSIVGLLINQFRLKQRTNKEINKKNLVLQHLVDEKEWLLKKFTIGSKIICILLFACLNRRQSTWKTMH